MSTSPRSLPYEPDYAWQVATLYPEQGEWSELEYFLLPEESKGRVELTDGRLEFLAMPTEIHEALVQYLLLALHQFVSGLKCGKVYSSGIRLRVRPGKIRLPDVIFLHKDHFRARHNQAWDGADLVMEVVSDDVSDRKRDYEQKLLDYAEGGVAEYWIVDAERRAVQVHRLDAGKYALHGEFSPGQQATSALLAGFAVDVAALFDAIKDIPE